MVNWVKFISVADVISPMILKKELWDQFFYLESNKEYHIDGNHLLSNLVALVMASCLSAHPYVKKIGSNAFDELHKELRIQVLDDGGHYEKSPMYQALIVEDLLDIANLYSLRPDTRDHLEVLHYFIFKMLGWLENFRFSDNDYSLFNDTYNGNVLDFDSLRAYYRRIFNVNFNMKQAVITHLKETGFVRYHCGDCELLIDIGTIGPDHLTGHSHADVSSFEIYLFGQKVLSNLGVSTYENNERRLFERSSDAHNTITVNGRSSAKCWRAFRTSYRPNIISSNVMQLDDDWIVKVKYSGFGYRWQRSIHERVFVLSQNSLLITDQVWCAKMRKNAVRAFFHLHPNISIQNHSHNSLFLSIAEKSFATVQFDYEYEIMPSIFSNNFERVYNTCSIVGKVAPEIINKTYISW
ncbi:heparinase II/III family protein [Planktomarina temperata]|nr:heparinase II/III family protein [Planktomarina temperata]